MFGTTLCKTSRMNVMLKNLLLLILSLVWIGAAWGQEVFKPKDTITLLKTIIIDGKNGNKPFEYTQDIDFIKSLNTLVANTLKSGYKYIILKDDVASNKVQLQLLNFKVYNTYRIKRRNKDKNFLGTYTLDKSIYSILYNDKIFEVKRDDFLVSATKRHHEYPDKLNIGILTLPFKFRPQGDMSFDTDFNLNSTLAVRLFGVGNGHLSIQVGAGIGGVELNEINSKIAGNATIKANALSMLGGLMVQYKKVQAGFYTGTDFINNQTHYQWNYQGKSWLAFGVGYQLFDVGLGSGGKSNN